MARLDSNGARTGDISTGTPQVDLSHWHGCRLSVPASMEHFDAVWASLERLLVEAGVSEDERGSWCVTLIELYSNAVHHGAASDHRHSITIEWAVNENVIELSISDPGAGPATEYTEEPCLPVDPRQGDGRGLYMIYHFCDDWEHWRGEHGYRCVIRKSLPHRVPPALNHAEAPYALSDTLQTLSLLRDLGTALVAEKSAAEFVRRGVRHLVGLLKCEHRDVTIYLSESLQSEIAKNFDVLATVLPSDDAPTALSKVMRDGRGIDWQSSRESRGAGCCHPMIADGEHYGCLVYMNASAEEISLAASSQVRMFADLFGVAIRNEEARTHQLEEEARLREGVLLDQLRQTLMEQPANVNLRGWELTCRSRTSKAVSGDQMDTFVDARGRVIVSLSDVMGSGADAGLIALIFKAALKSHLGVSEDLGRFLQFFNTSINQWQSHKSRFLTNVIVRFDEETDEIEVINAGHCPVLLMKKDGGSRTVSSSGPPIGALKEATYESSVFAASEIEALVLVSDGVFEWCEESNPWGWERFVQFTEETFTGSVAGFWEALQARIKQGGGHDTDGDDQTLVCCRRLDVTNAVQIS